MCVFCIVTLYKLAPVCRLKPTKLVFVLYFYFQYLDFGGFDGTLAEFERECRAKNKPINDLDKRAHGDEKRIMAQVGALHCGRWWHFSGCLYVCEWVGVEWRWGS